MSSQWKCHFERALYKSVHCVVSVLLVFLHLCLISLSFSWIVYIMGIENIIEHTAFLYYKKKACTKCIQQRYIYTIITVLTFISPRSIAFTCIPGSLGTLGQYFVSVCIHTPTLPLLIVYLLCFTKEPDLCFKFNQWHLLRTTSNVFHVWFEESVGWYRQFSLLSLSVLIWLNLCTTGVNVVEFCVWMHKVSALFLIRVLKLCVISLERFYPLVLISFFVFI